MLDEGEEHPVADFHVSWQGGGSSSSGSEDFTIYITPNDKTFGNVGAYKAAQRIVSELKKKGYLIKEIDELDVSSEERIFDGNIICYPPDFIMYVDYSHIDKSQREGNETKFTKDLGQIISDIKVEGKSQEKRDMALRRQIKSVIGEDSALGSAEEKTSRIIEIFKTYQQSLDNKGQSNDDGLSP